VAREYGDLSSFRVGAQRFFLINHPDLVREVFVTKAGSFVNGWGPVAGNTVLGNGLLTSEGALHQQQRRLTLPALHRGRLEEYAEIVVRHGRALVDRWPDVEVDVLDEARHVTLRVLGEALFGTDISPLASRLTDAVGVVFGRFSGRLSAFARFIRRSRVRSAAAAAAASRTLRGVAHELIAARRSAPGNDLISMLLEARDEDGQPLHDGQIVDEVVTFLVAGHETVAVAFAFAWALLARDERAQSRLHDELDSVLRGREPGWDDLKSLPYAQGVIAEALRLYPPQWMLGRRAVECVEVGGHEVPPGAVVLLCLPALHRDPRWFDAPEEFRPARWSAGIDKAAMPFTYVPFGVGTRRCIGEGFAWMEATLLLSMLAGRFRAKPMTSEILTESLILLRPRKTVLRFERRASQSAARARSIG
jgi:cytochrome P450